ncbi:MAG: NAD(P)-dependent oxidoreductase [Armatimonadetes bacterium]|nr:NAD(P)-dependent oxidoreductase [Armatimonadota bacterium]
MRTANAPVAPHRGRVALIGYGLLGSAICERLVAHAYGVTVFDRDPQRTLAAASSGLAIASSHAEAVTGADTLLMAVMTTPDVVSIVECVGASRLAGKLLIDCTTGHPEQMAALGERLSAMGTDYLEAMVAGSSAQMRAGEALVLLSGPESVMARAAGVVSALSSRAVAVGPWGHASRMKLVFNLVLGLNRAVLAEGLGLAAACGIDPATALAVLRSGATYSRVMDTKGMKMLTGDWSPQARLRQHLKDVELIADLASACDLSVPFTAQHRALLDDLVGAGFGDLDNSAVALAYGLPASQHPRSSD